MERAESDLESLPGAEIVLPGLADLRAGRQTADSESVLLARGRLVAVGVDVPEDPNPGDEPAHRLYGLLSEAEDPFSTYNAILRRVDSFARALEGATPR